jgi:hypothetical protein
MHVTPTLRSGSQTTDQSLGCRCARNGVGPPPDAFIHCPFRGSPTKHRITLGTCTTGRSRGRGRAVPVVLPAGGTPPGEDRDLQQPPCVGTTAAAVSTNPCPILKQPTRGACLGLPTRTRTRVPTSVRTSTSNPVRKFSSCIASTRIHVLRERCSGGRCSEGRRRESYRLAWAGWPTRRGRR